VSSELDGVPDLSIALVSDRQLVDGLLEGLDDGLGSNEFGQIPQGVWTLKLDRTVEQLRLDEGPRVMEPPPSDLGASRALASR